MDDGQSATNSTQNDSSPIRCSDYYIRRHQKRSNLKIYNCGVGDFVSKLTFNFPSLPSLGSHNGKKNNKKKQSGPTGIKFEYFRCIKVDICF